MFDEDTKKFTQDIYSIINSLHNVNIQRALFSATLDKNIMELTNVFLNEPYQISIGNAYVCLFVLFIIK